MGKKRINFLPQDLRPKREFPVEIVPLSLYAILVMYVGISMLNNRLDTNRTHEKLDQLVSENNSLSLQIQVLTEQSKKLDQNNEVLGTLQKVLNRKNYWSEIFKELSILIPKGIWLTSFANSTTNDQLVLKGESGSQDLIAGFLKTLETSHHFSGARMIFSEKQNEVQPTRYQFEFVIPVKASNGGGT